VQCVTLHPVPIPSSRPGLAALLGAALTLLHVTSAIGGERYTVCSITINSDDEIRKFRKLLPASQFDFVELTAPAQTAPMDGGPAWLAQACESGIRCDVLVVSGHFANPYAGTKGTTFAGTSDLSISLEDLARRTCDQSCPGVLSDPLEVFLFGCRTLATSLDAEAIPPGDLALLSSQHVPPRVAERIIEEVSYGGEDTSNLARMRFVFSGVPRLYGFADVAPTGENVAPRVETYLKNSGDYAKHLRRLRAAREAKQAHTPNRVLERSLGKGTFTQSSGLGVTEPEHELETRACFLANERNSVLARLEHMEKLLEARGFLAFTRAMGAFLRNHDPAGFGGAELAALERIRNHGRSRVVVDELVRRLENPILRHEILRVSRAIGWIPDDNGLRLQREIVLQLLQPPVYGEARNLICGIEPNVLTRLAIQDRDVPPEVYRDEFGIQALGCLKPSDERIHERLARSLLDPRDWIARLTAVALKGMSPGE
jgi:hypothetical protein